jgi:hypothetical protein
LGENLVMVEFKEWPKIPRGQGEDMTITEKIDGTNACIIVENGEVVGCQSRSQLLAHNNIDGILRIYNDNFGFAEYVLRNKEELAKLGDGYHYGEWAGPGIQKNHHNLERKTLFLFNSDRWRDGRQQRPEGVECVPILYEGPANREAIAETMNGLWATAKERGYHPEGVVIWYHKTKRYEKVTFENANGKWANA